MSWFDTSKGFASLAKTALKEAQKQIDKALDIQEQSVGEVKMAEGDILQRSSVAAVAVGTKKLPGGANRERSKTEPNTPMVEVASTTTFSKDDSASATAATSTIGGATTAPATAVPLTASTWGSFTGSFFENPKANEMVTTPPKASALVSPNQTSTALSAELATVPAATSMSTLAASGAGMKRQSVTSNSDSVELLSSPISQGSELASPSDAANNNSESVELLTATTASEIATLDSSSSLPESIVIIASNEGADEEDEEDSVSYNTVMDDNDTTAPTDVSELSKAHTAICEESKANTPHSSTMHGSHYTLCSSGNKLLTSLRDISYESQTFDSDSTQSFEEVQLQLSGTASQCSAKAGTVSPTSADKLEDLIKQAAQSYSSPHNSNDEMETTTSSDIEIISNPNGDSSSTNSITRSSPLKAKQSLQSQAAATLQSSTAPTSSSMAGKSKKGHYREPSEISILSEDSQSETDKLLQRISELNGILETREMRLLQSERQNAELQDRNSELQATLDALKSDTASLDSAEEYTQRLSALEKKFQASIRERDALRIQIKSLRNELQNKVPKDDLTQLENEKDAMIEELRQEGEKLSKEVLHQSNIIKKLRVKEKSSDALLKKQREQLASMSDELERLKKTLSAREDVERSQIEAVHKMSSEKRRLEEENAQQSSKMEDLQTKLTTLETNFDAVKGELQQRVRLHTDLTRTAEEAATAKQERELTKAANQEMQLQVQELREKLRSCEHSMVKREQQLREENKELLWRLEAAELRAETSTHEVSQTTIPLMRQLEALQNTLSQRTSNWNKEEKELLDKLAAAQTRLKSLESVEHTFREKVDLLQVRCRDLEEKLSHALMQEEQVKISMHQAQLDYSLKETNTNRQLASLNEALQECQSTVATLEETKRRLEDNARIQLETQASHAASHMEEAEVMQRELSTAALHEMTVQHQQQQRAQSPTASCGINSLEDAMGGSVDWQADDLDCISNSGRQGHPLVYGMHLNFMGHNTSTLEHLQSLLKQRDGELTHLQWELSRLQAERSMLTEEVSSLTLELENIKDKLQSQESLEENLADLQHRYDALLQMYGEKVERTEELELDLVELKEAYKTQIDELLAQPRPSSAT